MRALFLGPILAATAAAGCATKIYQGPTSGRAAEAQIAAATSADRAFQKLELKALAGKKVHLEVVGLTERLERDSPEEAYVRGILVEQMLRERVPLATSIDDAEVLLVVTLRAAGVDVIRRDVPFIYGHHTFRGLTSARVVAYRLTRAKEGAVASSIVLAQQVEGQSIYREGYVLYIFGPIQTRE
jgi:hypothetical protein